MGRAPCCDKVGLKRGPWTAEEDQILISFIQRHGHSNWRALPKQAGLLRCGKSCRLRWINYLRPDIKRGNFSREEEETIIQLHEVMGNRWSAIAARLPRRTDNEIKNVWHTHLKKRLEKYQPTKSQPKKGKKIRDIKNVTSPTTTESTSSENNSENNSDQFATSPQQSYTISEDFSSVTEVSSFEFHNNGSNNSIEDAQAFDSNSIEEYFPIIDDTFWESEKLPLDDNKNNNNMSFEYSNVIMEDNLLLESLLEENFAPVDNQIGTENYGEDDMDFWLDVFVQAGGAQQLQEF